MHGSIGTSCAVADVQGGKATIWSPTQSAYPTRSGVAMLLGLPADNVRVIFTRGSGCYGINGADTVSYDAALLSQAVGKPVRVQLSRKDEMAWENYGFAVRRSISASALDADGTHRRVGLRGVVAVARRPARLRARRAMSSPACWPASSRRRSRRAQRRRRPASFDNGSNAAPSYVAGPRRRHAAAAPGTVASERVLTHTVASPFFTGPLRSPSRLQNTFAHESFIDEIAAHVKADPVAYRLRHLQRPAAEARSSRRRRRRRTGRRVRRRSPASPRTGVATRPRHRLRAVRRRQRLRRDGRRSRGRSGDRRGHRQAPRRRAGLRPDLESRRHAQPARRRRAAGAEPRARRRSDVGRSEGDVDRLADLSQPAARVRRCRRSRACSINRTDVEATGAGETAITIVAAAVGNAIFDATGARIREVPFTPERVKAALAARTR